MICYLLTGTFTYLKTSKQLGSVVLSRCDELIPPGGHLSFFLIQARGTKDVSGVIIVFTSLFLSLEMSSLFCPRPPFQLLHFSSLAAPTVYRAAEVSEY